MKTPPKPATEETAIAAPARIVVKLPADAKLFVDGNATKASEATRVFASPTLEPGREYYYTFTGELSRNGQMLTANKQIAVHAGQQVEVQLDFSSTALAQR